MLRSTNSKTKDIHISGSFIGRFFKLLELMNGIYVSYSQFNTLVFFTLVQCSNGGHF